MTVLQNYSDIQAGGRDNFRCDFSGNMAAGDVIENIIVTVPPNFVVNSGPVVGTLQADGKTFVEDPAGTWVEANISVGASNGAYKIIWDATMDSGTRVLPVTYGINVTPRS